MKEETELYKKYRPKKLSRMVGQEDVATLIEKKLKNGKLPHAVLFTGPSGCGKTTLARIVRKGLGCGNHDYTELNNANDRGIQAIRNIDQRMHTSPLEGDCRVWLFDEAHKITPDAQAALLKMLEDTPSHVYFMLSTTNPHRLIKEIRTRCTEFIVRKLQPAEIYTVLKRISKKEKIKLTKPVVEKIVQFSEGSARKAVVLLEQIMDLDSEKKMLEAITKTTVEKQSEFIGRMLFRSKMPRWVEMAKYLQKCQDEDAESLRRGILGYANKVLISGGNMSGRAYLVIDAFENHIYDSGHPGLSKACYEVVVGVD